MHLRMTLAGVCTEPVTLRAPRLRSSTTVPPLAVARATCRTADTVTLLSIHHVLILITMPDGEPISFYIIGRTKNRTQSTKIVKLEVLTISPKLVFLYLKVIILWFKFLLSSARMLEVVPFSRQ